MRRYGTLLTSLSAAALVVAISNCGGMEPGSVGGGSAGGGTSTAGGGSAGGGSAEGGGSADGGSAGGGSAEGGGSAGGGSAGGGSAGGGSAGGGSAGGGSAGGGSAAGGAGGGSAGGGTAGGGSAGGGSAGGGSAGGGSATLPNFSFFVTSIESMRLLSNSQDGFGGDLSFGETGVGAGLRGADKICTTIAEKAMPGSGAKVWRAFLSASVSADGGSAPTHAIERIGNGPWFDRIGRLVAADAGMLNVGGTRPTSAIFADLPNETGVGNHGNVDNHDTLTGSNASGRYVNNAVTCMNWTSKATTIGRPNIGHSWPRSATSGRNWISDHPAGGCGAGVTFGNSSNPTVGGLGGYGGIYCFALNP